MSAKKDKQVAVYPGSFDPPTNGHLNIIQRGAALFDHLVVAIATNTSKKGVFSVEERIEMLKAHTRDLSNVSYDSFQGLLVTYMKDKGYRVVLRGVRTMSDYEFEFQMALSNKHLDETVETVFMMTDGKYSHLSSSLIREIVALGGSTKGMIPKEIEKALAAKLHAAKK